MTTDADHVDGVDGPLDIPARQRGLPAAGRALHQHILRAFAEHGTPPSLADLRPAAKRLGLDLDLALRKLAEADLVHLDGDGVVEVAYPFSGRATGITVQLSDGPHVHAMCAIDALGISPMTGRDGVITATDPGTGEPVEVESAGGRWTWRPEATAVLLAANGGGPTVAASACPTITFHTTERGAQAYLDSHSDLTGRVLARDQALRVSAHLFGDLLA